MKAKKNMLNIPFNFYCEKCNYGCSKKSCWNQHILTSKHLKANNELIQANKEYSCIKCDIKFNHQSSYCRHKKKCNGIENKEIILNNEITNYDINNKDELIIMLLKQNSLLIEQNSEFVKNGMYNVNNSHNTNNTNNSYNKSFNLNFFLNETCKNAMNIMEFVDSVKLQLSDLEKVGELGYIDGISNIIIQNLKELDIDKRPVHCTDAKRDVIYVKDDNKWEKENEDCNKIRKVIKCIANKNINLIPEWKKNNPDCIKYNSKKSDICNNIIIEAMGGRNSTTKISEDKIIKKIAKEMIIDKL
jgi:hypothetical protein